MKTEQEIIEKIVEIELKIKELDNSEEGKVAELFLKAQIDVLRWVIQS